MSMKSWERMAGTWFGGYALVEDDDEENNKSAACDKNTSEENIIYIKVDVRGRYFLYSI